MGETRPGAESARRALRLLFAFQEHCHTQTVRQLADAVGIPLPSAHRYVALLRDEGLLAEAGPGKYRLSPRVFSLARAAEAAEPFVELADPVMRRLSDDTGETVLLVEIVDDAAVCVHRVESRQRLRLSYEPGQALPLSRGASARLLLSGLPVEARRRHLSEVADLRLAELLAEVEQDGRRGWATSREEIDEGIWAAAAAIVDRGRVMASLSVPCPLPRASPAAQERILVRVRSAAAELNEALRARTSTVVVGRRNA